MIVVVHGGPGLADHSETYPGLRNLLLRDDHLARENIGEKCPHDHDQYRRLTHGMFFYDQLGCGKSDKPIMKQFNKESDVESSNKVKFCSPIELYTLAYYRHELQQVLSFVQTRHPTLRLCLLGHSWGGQLLLEWALSSPLTTAMEYDESATPSQDGNTMQSKDIIQGKESCDNNHTTTNMTKSTKRTKTQHCPTQGGVIPLIVSNAPLDERTYEQKQQYMRSLLDPETQKYYEEEEEALAKENSIGMQIFQKLIGPSDLQIIGSMKNWSIWTRMKTLFSLSDNCNSNKYSCAFKCLFICSDDDTVPDREYRQLRDIKLQEQQQQQEQEHGKQNNDQLRRQEQSLSGSIDTKCPSTDKISNSDWYQVVIVTGGGHGPFYGSTSNEYFDHILSFLSNSSQ